MDFPLRRLAIPHDHMLAEVAALPLASEEAFGNGLVVLHPLLSDEGGRATKALWREAERILTRSFPSVSLDDLTNLRDWVWFAGEDEGPRRPVSLRRYVRRVAGIWTGVADEATGNSRLSAAQARRRDRWLSFALPRGLVDGSDPPPMPPRLEQVLAEEGFAESHLHAGVGMEFRVLWAAAGRSVAVTPPKRDEFRAPGAAFREGAEIAAWLVRAMVVRYLLAGYLYEPHDSIQILPWIKRRLSRLGGGRLSRLLAVLDEVSIGRMHAGVEYEEVVDLYRLLVGSRRSREYQERAEVLHGDPVAAFFPGSTGFPDVRFHEAAREHLGRLERADELPERGEAFAHLYWQLVRLQAIFYRHVVQRPMTPGLMWFIRTYAHASPAKKMLSWRFLVKEAQHTSGEGRGLRSLEVRTAPEATVAGNKAFVDVIDTLVSEPLYGLGTWSRLRASYPDGTSGRAGLAAHSESVGQSAGQGTAHAAEQPCELGLVLHFVKDRGGGSRQGTPSAFWDGTNAMPEIGRGFSPIRRFRYAPYYREQRRRAVAVGELLLRYPWTLQFLRGLDCCTDEQGVPTWVLAPLFRYLRLAGERARNYLASGQDGASLQSLGLTAHVGEDFVYLTSGLRRISEAVDHFGMSEGDRIGHGMALGMDPETWAKETGPVLLAREDRLFDLVWERACLLQDDSSGPTNRLSRIEHLLRDQALQIFPNHRVDLDMIDRFVAFLHDGQQLEEIGFPDDFSRRTAPWGSQLDRDARRLLRGYLTDPDIFRRGRELIQVDPVPEVDAIRALQSRLRSHLGHLGIPVEVNPSSNLLIGNLGDIGNHPIFRLSPIQRQSRDIEGEWKACPASLPVSVCVGSDDPLVFACDLPRELALLHDTLVSWDVPPEAAMRWIRDVIRVGRHSRFTRPPAGSIDRSVVVGLGRGLAPIP